MLFIETPIFTRRVKELLEDDTYRLLQVKLMSAPDAGDLIECTGGLRKLRVAASGHGKRGGARVIYYHFTPSSQQGPEEHHRALEAYMSKFFEELMESVQQMDEIVQGKRVPSRVVEIDALQVRNIRKSTGLSQVRFAEMIDVQVATLRNWEQGRREPTGPAKALLRAIRNDPDHVLRALAY